MFNPATVEYSLGKARPDLLCPKREWFPRALATMTAEEHCAGGSRS